MRLGFPGRVPYLWATVFAASLATVELIEHTNLLFAFCVFAYMLVAAAAFNIAGGLTTVSGAYVFFNTTLSCVLGLVVKAAVGEAGESNLRSGVLTMEIYLLGMVSMLAAVVLERRFRAVRPLVSTHLKIPNLRLAYVGCAVLGLLLDLKIVFLGHDVTNSLLTTLENVNYFTIFAILLGTIYTVRSSGGRRSLSPLLLFLLLFNLGNGLLSFSKQAIYNPIVCWILGLCLARYRLRVRDLLILAGAGFFLFTYATPFAQYGRSFRADGPAYRSIPVALFLFENFDQVERGYQAAEDVSENRWHYYNGKLGIFERLTTLPQDDALIDLTTRAGTFGFEPIIEGIENLVPHVLWADKPVPYFGNVFSREIGGVDEADTSTGVSFGPSADAFHEGGVLGVSLLFPIVLGTTFLVLSSLLGKVTEHPATLVFVLALAHQAAEGGFYNLSYLVTLSEMSVFLAFVCRYFLPIAGSIFERTPGSAESARLAQA